MNAFERVQYLLNTFGYQTDMHPGSLIYKLRYLIVLLVYVWCIIVRIINVITTFHDSNDVPNKISIIFMMFLTTCKMLTMFFYQKKINNLFQKIQRRVDAS